MPSRTWLASTNIERLEAGQFQLLPMLYPQLEQTAVDHPWLPRLKGIYRRTWFANQLALRAAAAALQVLTDALPARPAAGSGSAGAHALR